MLRTKHKHKTIILNSEKYQDSKTTKLTIKDVVDYDAGVYICEATNTHGKARSKPITVTVTGGRIYLVCSCCVSNVVIYKPTRYCHGLSIIRDMRSNLKNTPIRAKNKAQKPKQQ